MINNIQPFIDLKIHTVPLKGELKRLENGGKTLPKFEKDWRAKYDKTFNKTDSPLGGAITGEVSGIVAIDCDNSDTWDLFRSLDQHNEFVFLSKGKGYSAGTLIYKYDSDLAENFSIQAEHLNLDFYSNKGFVYLPTKQNKTKVPLKEPLPEIPKMPKAVKALLLELHALKNTVPAEQNSNFNVNVMTANCQAPLVEQFCKDKDFMPGLFKIITPKDFRNLPQYVEQGYLHPDNVPEGRGSEYLSKISAILGADISISHELYVKAMNAINELFDTPLEQKRLESTIMDPMVNKTASVNGKTIWQYDEKWKQYRMILRSKRQSSIELAFDDIRDMYYVVDAANTRYKSFNRDSEMMAYIESIAMDTPKKLEVKRSLPIANVQAIPNKPFGFNEHDDPTTRVLNTFVQTPELAIFNEPEIYKDKYKQPYYTLKYLATLVPEKPMRDYLLSFIKTKLTTFKYSPVVLYFMGQQGSGKDVFVKIIESIMGHVGRPTTREFLELFNGWMLDTYFVQLDEYGNQLTNIREKEEALGKLMAYTGKQQVQIRRMRTDGFIYKHNITFIMTANKNPLMLMDGDRRIAFFSTPNILASQDWVIAEGGVSTVVDKILEEIKDFSYYLATEVSDLSPTEYMKPPESDNKHELIADSMHAAQRLAYSIKHGMRDYLIDLAEEYDCEVAINAFKTNSTTTEELIELYYEMTEHAGDARNLLKVLRGNGIDLKPSTREGHKIHKIYIGSESPFVPDND